MINVTIKDFVWNKMFGKKITLTFSGDFNNEQISLNAMYDEYGKLIECSAAYSARNSADYYIEVAKYFSLMKEYEGENILKIINKILPEYTILNNAIYEKHMDSFECRNELRKLVDIKKDLNSKIKRFKKQEKIDEFKAQIAEVQVKADAIYGKISANDEFEKANNYKIKEILKNTDLKIEA